jgi:hypothetical protein
MADDKRENLEALLEEGRLKDVADRVVEAQRAAGTEVDAETAAAAEERARQMVEGIRAGSENPAENPLAGADDLFKLNLALGLPMPRILFESMVAHANATEKRKAHWRKQLANMTTVKETGCMRADFYDTITEEQNTAFLVLDRCGADHDFGAELAKIEARILPEKVDDIKKHISALLLFGRMAYGHMMQQVRSTLDEIAKKLPADFDYRSFVVDEKNTTLYLKGLPGTERVGVFVRFESELSD